MIISLCRHPTFRRCPLASWSILAAGLGLFTFSALPVIASPMSFTECPAVGNDTSGCQLLITVTAVGSNPAIGLFASAFTVTQSSTDLGSYRSDGDGTLIGVLNESNSDVNKIFLAVAPDTGNFAFDQKGACLGVGPPGSLTSAYTPGPTAAECNHGYQTIDAFDYTSAGVTFCSFNRADACVFVGEPAGILHPGASTWFSLPGALTASDITIVNPTPEPSLLIPLGIGLSALCFMRRRKAQGSL
jgi:hypothetical protein